MSTIRGWKRQPRASVQHKDLDRWIPPVSNLLDNSDALNVLRSKMGQRGGGCGSITSGGELVVDGSVIPRMLDLVGLSTLEVRKILQAAIRDAGLTLTPGTHRHQIFGNGDDALRQDHSFGYEDGIQQLRWVEEYGSLLYLYCSAAGGGVLNPAARCSLGLDTIVPLHNPSSTSFGQICAPFADVVPLLVGICGTWIPPAPQGQRLPSRSSTVAHPQNSLPSGVQGIHASLEVTFSSTTPSTQPFTFPLARYIRSLLALDRTFTSPLGGGVPLSSPFYDVALNTLGKHSISHPTLGTAGTYFDEALLTLLQLAASFSSSATSLNKHALCPVVIRTALLVHHRIQQDVGGTGMGSTHHPHYVANRHHPLSVIVMPNESGIEVHSSASAHIPPSVSRRAMSGGFVMPVAAKDALLQGSVSQASSKPSPASLLEMGRDMEVAMHNAPPLPLRATHGFGDPALSRVDAWFQPLTNLHSSTAAPLYSMPTMDQLKLLTSRCGLSRGVCALSLPIAAEYRNHRPSTTSNTTNNSTTPPALLSASKASHKALLVAIDVLLVGEHLASTRPSTQSKLNLPSNFWKYSRVCCQVHAAVSKYIFGFYSSIPVGLSSQPSSASSVSANVSDVVLHDVHVYREELLAKVALRGAKQALDDLHGLYNTLGHTNMSQLAPTQDHSALMFGAGILFCLGLVHSSNYHYQREKPVVESLVPHALPCMLLARSIGSKIYASITAHNSDDGATVLGAVFPVVFFNDFLFPDINRLADILLQENSVVFQESVPRSVEQVLGVINGSLVDSPTAMLDMLGRAFRAATSAGIIPSNFLDGGSSSSTGVTPRSASSDTTTDVGRQLSAAVEDVLINLRSCSTSSGTPTLSDDFLEHLVVSAIQASPSDGPDPIDSRFTSMCRSVVGWMVGCASSPTDISNMDVRLKRIIAEKAAQSFPPTPMPSTSNNNLFFSSASNTHLQRAEVDTRPIEAGVKRSRDYEQEDESTPQTSNTPFNREELPRPRASVDHSTPTPHQVHQGRRVEGYSNVVETVDDDGDDAPKTPSAKISGGLLGRMRAIQDAKKATRLEPSTLTPPPPPPPSLVPTTHTNDTTTKISSGLLSRIRKASNK